MALTQVQIDGDVARAAVRAAYSAAMSTYTGACTAEVYDAETGALLGEAEAKEYVVEHAWIVAARRLSAQ